MRLLYLDDSGSPGNLSEEYCVLAGIALPETSVRWLSHELHKLAQAIAPHDPDSIEFHASEIFKGATPPWDQIPKLQRIQIIKDVLNTINNTFPETVLFACAIHKASFPGEDPVIKAYEDLSSRFNLHLEHTPESERGLLILDKTSYETGLQQLALKIRRDGNRWGQYSRRIIEVPLFIDSHASRIVQLADHIAYAVFRRYNSGDLNYFNLIEGRFDKLENVICGLAHLQKINPNCTCPACLTRR